MNRNQHGLTLNVLRNAGGDYSLNGITNRYDTLTLVGTLLDQQRAVTPMPARAQIFSPGPDRPPVALFSRWIGGKVLCLVPVEWDETTSCFIKTGGLVMFGGNYAAGVDSRISELAQELTGHPWYGAFAVHDRIESPERYRAMTIGD